ncbi:MAG: putative transcriptional regulator, TetR family [Thermomicrobiales bacterium]|nr:putative transcriptional regulator, TetR family [Thermomicrobiales bacterium]
MNTETTARLPGRQSEAARNDRRILEAARDVFTADPKAPISAVAERAGVGISALYRRYRSKEELVQGLSLIGLRRYSVEVEAALGDDGDPWDAFAAFMRRAVAADTSSLTLHLAGTFTPTEAHWRDGEKAFQLNTRLLDRTKLAGVLRQEFGVGDLSLVFEQLAAIKVGDPERTAQLRQRYLALLLDGLRDTSAASLPGSPPSWEEISRRWEG